MKKLYFLLLTWFSTTAIFSQGFSNELFINRSIPVVTELFDFNANRTFNGVEFSWVDNEDDNIISQEIEKSTDGNYFTTLGNISIQEVASAFNRHTYIDATPVQGPNYYRIRRVDRNGNIYFSRVLKVDDSYGRPELNIIPNPVKSGVLNIQLKNMGDGKYTMALYSNAGLRIFARSFDYTAGSALETVYLPAQVASGTYFLQFTNGQTIINKQVFIQ